MRRPFLLGSALFLVLAAAAGALLRGLARPGFIGDGVGHYAPLASLVWDHDLDLRNELAHLPPEYLRAAHLTPDGRLGDPFPIGAALLWAPGVLITRSLPPHPRFDASPGTPIRTSHPGFAPRFARAVLWTDALAVACGGAALAGSMAPVVGVVVAALGVLAAILGTPTFFYVLVSPSYGHSLSFAVVSLLLSMLFVDRRRRLPLWLFGAALGLVTLVRWQDSVLGLLLAPRLLDDWCAHGTSSRRRISLVLAFVLPVVLVLSPQMLFWARIYGRPLLVPPGPDFLPLWRPQVLPLLLSTWNGAWIWSPLLFVGTIGLALWNDRRLRMFAFAAIALEIYICSIVLDWWGGASFGARRLVSTAPLAAVGLALWLQRVQVSRVRMTGFVVLLLLGCLWSTRLATYWSKGLLPANPGSAADYVRFYTPGSRHTQRYGLWDHPRLLSEVVEAERLSRAAARRVSGLEGSRRK